jgi:hypothetical protein
MFREGMGCVARHHGDNRRGLASRDRDPPRNEGPFCLGTFCAAPEMAAASRGRPGTAGARALALSEDGCTSADGRPNYPQARSWITPRLGAAPCASQSDDNRKGSTSKRQGAPDGDLCLSGLAGIGGDPDRKGERACAPHALARRSFARHSAREASLMHTPLDGSPGAQFPGSMRPSAHRPSRSPRMP